MEIGVDIVKIDRLKDVDQHFINRVYTQEEINVYNSLSSDKKIVFLASRWAVKEAIFKANNQKDYLSYGCVNDINGKPYIVNHFLFPPIYFFFTIYALQRLFISDRIKIST